jgi:hypothetical protein
MILLEQPEIWRAAKRLVDESGVSAGLYAAQHADELLALGDREGTLMWLAILRAIEEMQRTERREGEIVN